MERVSAECERAVARRSGPSGPVLKTYRNSSHAKRAFSSKLLGLLAVCAVTESERLGPSQGGYVLGTGTSSRVRAWPGEQAVKRRLSTSAHA